MSLIRRILARAALAAAFAVAGGAAHADAASEKAAAAVFNDVAGNAASLRAFLQAMPKGGDLHNHLGGTPYAEDYLGRAAEAGMCVDASGLRLAQPPCPAERTVGALAERQPFAFARLVDSLSTRGVQQGVGADAVSGHGQFFSSFEKFGPAYQLDGSLWQVIARKSAARDNVSYLELMHMPPVVGEYIRGGGTGPLTEVDLTQVLERESAALGPVLDTAVAELDREEAATLKLMRCGTDAADAACSVTVRYLGFALRGLPPVQVFRSLIGGFALADRDPRVLGVNIVMPEDDPVALRDYRLHMAMYRLLKAKYPKVRLTMHAGEMALGLVPPEALRDHIAQAVAAGAERIGHGTDIAYEDAALQTMATMAAKGIAVEVNLTSNAVILGVSGGEHPIQLYRRMGVPVVLSTDDMGVLRSDMTNEYRRAVMEQGFTYPELKHLARASLEHAFVPGASLWRDRSLGTPVAVCARSLADAACRSLLDGNDKARLQADLEARFDRFEHSLAPFLHNRNS